MRTALWFPLAASLWLATPIYAEPQSDASIALSEASSASFEGGTALISGLAEGVSYTLVALEPLGEGAVALFEGSATAAQISLELTGKAAATAGRHVGEAVELLAVAGGTALSLGGEVIAFVPNELNRSLNHRQRISR